MPGLVCLNHLSTGVKSKSSPVCAIAQQLLVRSAEKKKKKKKKKKAGVCGRRVRVMLRARKTAAGMVLPVGDQNACSW